MPPASPDCSSTTRYGAGAEDPHVLRPSSINRLESRLQAERTGSSRESNPSHLVRRATTGPRRQRVKGWSSPGCTGGPRGLVAARRAGRGQTRAPPSAGTIPPEGERNGSAVAVGEGGESARGGGASPGGSGGPGPVLAPRGSSWQVSWRADPDEWPIPAPSRAGTTARSEEPPGPVGPPVVAIRSGPTDRRLTELIQGSPALSMIGERIVSISWPCEATSTRIYGSLSYSQSNSSRLPRRAVSIIAPSTSRI
jgi:hypothetical protein